MDGNERAGREVIKRRKKRGREVGKGSFGSRVLCVLASCVCVCVCVYSCACIMGSCLFLILIGYREFFWFIVLLMLCVGRGTRVFGWSSTCGQARLTLHLLYP